MKKKYNFKKAGTSLFMLAGLVATPLASAIASVPVSADTTVSYNDQVTTPFGWHDPDGKITADWEQTGSNIAITVSSAMVNDSITYKQLVGLNKGVGVANPDADKISIKKSDAIASTVFTGKAFDYKFQADGVYTVSFTDAKGNAVSMIIIVVPYDASVAAIPDPATIGQMYRVYNPNSGEHFYTASTYERDQLIKVGWNDEGNAWVAPEKSNTPVYRLYNPNAGDHFYTIDKAERDHLVSVGWNYESIGWYSDDAKTVPVYRAYNPNAVTGTHNYTTGEYEQKVLVGLGWKDEGIAWYALKK